MRLAAAAGISCAALAASWALTSWVPVLDTVVVKALLAGLAAYAAARIVMRGGGR